MKARLLVFDAFGLLFARAYLVNISWPQLEDGNGRRDGQWECILQR